MEKASGKSQFSRVAVNLIGPLSIIFVFFVFSDDWWFAAFMSFIAILGLGAITGWFGETVIKWSPYLFGAVLIGIGLIENAPLNLILGIGCFLFPLFRKWLQGVSKMKEK